MSKQQKADALLVMDTAFWGASYLVSDMCMEYLEPMNLNAFRFLSGFIALAIVFRKHLLHLNRRTIYYSLIVGLSLTGTYILYGYGLVYTSITNAAFICTTTVVFTPIMDLLINHRIPKKSFLLAMIICVIGLGLLTLGDSFRPALGDIICLGVPICYSLDLLLTEKATAEQEVDLLAVGVLQLAVVGLITLGFSFILETPKLPATPAVWAGGLFLGVVCSGIAFVIQVVEQKYTSASHVGLIFSLEPVFATISVYIFTGERLSTRGLIGAALMILSLLMIELDFKLPGESRKS